MNDLNARFSDFRNGVDAIESRPDLSGLFLTERELRAKIGEAVDSLSSWAKSQGAAPDNCDGVHNVEAVIYAWLTEKSPSYIGATVEGIGRYGFGKHGQFSRPPTA